VVATGVPQTAGKCTIDKKGVWLRIKLPSGHYLSYPGIKCEGKQLTFLGMNTYSRKWSRLKTYGGKLSENCTQAFCRDLFANGCVEAEKHGYEPILLVHDELVAEAPDNDEFSVEEMTKYLCDVPVWAKGMPINAKGFESYRYKKD
jgi:DNA polymerase